jgi:UDP-2,3-diacylglucosamine pyrophosphatase LpxH
MSPSIIAVSDIHLGYRDQFKQDDFLRFIQECDDTGIDHLVLAGDIIDMWRRRNVDIFSCADYTSKETARKIRKNAEILDKLGHMSHTSVHYVIGNHDFELLHMTENAEEPFPFPVTPSVRLHDGKGWNTFIHGHQLDVMANMEGWGIDTYDQWATRLCRLGDMTGGLANSFWTMKEKLEAMINAQVRMMVKNPGLRDGMERVHSFAHSKGAYLYLGIPPDDRLIFGHTHDMDLDYSQRVANTGCWGWPNKANQKNSYLTILDGFVKREFYSGGKLALS